MPQTTAAPVVDTRNAPTVYHYCESPKGCTNRQGVRTRADFVSRINGAAYCWRHVPAGFGGVRLLPYPVREQRDHQYISNLRARLYYGATARVI